MPGAKAAPKGHVLNFRERYADAIMSGAKRQTIRAHRKDGRVPAPGDVVHLFTGMRTKACKRLALGVVTTVFPVSIYFGSSTIVRDGLRLNRVEADVFAKLDGFSCAQEMIAWFRNVHAGKDSTMFAGHCVCWGPADGR